jgi:hypothetical protein
MGPTIEGAQESSGQLQPGWLLQSSRGRKLLQLLKNPLLRSAAVFACVLAVGSVALADTTSSISANFNGTAITSGDTIWFSSVLKPSGLGVNPVTIFVRKSTIQFTANGTSYNVPVPDANITFNPSVTISTISFDATKNLWQVTVPSSGLAGNTFLDSAQFVVPSGGLPGGIHSVIWQANFSTDVSGVSMQWQWAAAVYNSFNPNYASLGVKPVDDTKASQYQNSDHAGTPESYKTYVIGGASGGGGSNYTGSYSGTVSLPVPVVQPPSANAGGPYSGYVSRAISFDGSASSDASDYSLNYSWNFGDGTTGTGATAAHTYSSAGTFNVSLTVDDGRNVTGSSTTLATIAMPPPPTITATLSPAPNASGWNNSNVTVTFACTDLISGVKSCPPPLSLTTEGANQVVQGTATNNAGVSATVSPKINIDKTPPTVSASVSPASNSAGWNNTDVTVSFACLDSLSGVAQCPLPILISASGTNQIVSGSATDVAGNMSAPAKVSLNVELTLPSILLSGSPSANLQGWNKTDVTVSATCTQATSAITSCPSPQTISTEGASQAVSGGVTDAAGNSNSGQITLNIAKTPPTVTAAIFPQPNANGWNNSAATVTFTCTRTTAPLATCPQPQAVSAEGANQAVPGTVTDVAGNSATVTAHVYLATTLPTITASVSPQPNDNGWNNSAVTVTFVCTPTMAPIANCPSPQTISAEGPNQIITGTVTDVAGNSATAKVTLNIALTPPAITATASTPPDANGWNNSSVTVNFNCTSTTAPIASCPPSQTVSTEGAGQLVSGTVTDVAGNSATGSLTLSIGTKSPTVVPSPQPVPNAAGWNHSNVTVSFACAAGTAPIAVCPPSVTLSTEGANQSVTGTVTDVAANSGTTSLVVNIDKTPPTINGSISPAPGPNGINTTGVTITFICSDGLSGIASCPGPINVTTPGLNQTFSGTAVDIAGNTASASVTVNIQTAAPTPPSITASVSPGANAKSWNNTSVTVTFSCAAGSNPLASCSSPVVVSAEGANQSVCGQAVDTAGLLSSVCPKVSLDLTPPTIAISTQPSVNPSGWFTSPVSVTFACSDSLSGVATCPPAQQFSADGANQSVTGTATDNAGNTATSASYKISIDQTLPSILQFSSPTQLAPGQSGTATVTATDNIGVASVVFQLNGTIISTLLGPPYAASFTIPGTANAGDTVTLTVVVSDLAGNANSSSRGIQVVAAGVVVGQVLSDVNGLPFEGATVQVVGGDDDDTSDDNGRYSIPADNSHLFLSVSTVASLSTGVPATVPVEREVSVQTGVGTVPIDARLTPVGPGIPIGSAGGTLTSGSLTISIPVGAISATTSLHLTTLSQQGLPGLLPLAWSPIVAFDLRADSSTSAAVTANFGQLPNALTLHLVAYDYSAHAWKMVTPNLGAVNGALTIPLASLGNYALVSTDIGNTTVATPSAGQPLTGVTMVVLPASTTASGSLNPASVAPTGGTSAATLAVLSPTPLPSGTVIQANVTESYSLASGKQLSGQRRTEDILVYQAGAPSGATAAATFPVTPSETFQIGEVSAGNVHLDLLSGRESVRGQIGGNDAATVQGGDATLTVAAGSLPKNTAVSVSPEGLDNFLPTTTNLTPLSEYNVDLSGQTLTSAAQLSVAAGTAQAGDNIFLVQVQRIAGAPYLVVVGQAQLNGANLVTLAAPGLSGITQGGDFVFYKLSSPTGFVSGTVTTSSGPVAAMVRTDGLPFVAFANFAGSYVIPALAGSVNLTASVPNTALAGSGSAQVIAGQTATANLTLVGQIESATVTPPNGAVGVPLTAEIDITAGDAFNQAAVTTANVTLTQTGQGSNVPVPVRFVFSQGGTKLAVFPLTALQPSTTYTVAASGLANGVGGLIAVPTVSFTTQAITPPNFNTDALVFAMPDQNDNVSISTPANSFPPGTTILIVDQTNGVVLSLTVANDGSVSGQMPSTIDDVLAVTITAPDKTTASFTRSKFVAPDGTTAIGPGGGTITGTGNIAMIIPDGALNKGTTFKLELLNQTDFPLLPISQGANFGSGIKITAPAMPSFNKEVKLAFPVPANAPQGAFYYVYRRLVDPNDNGKILFETIDHAFVQGSGANAQVVTASPPFCGYRNSFGNFLAAATGGFQPLQTAITFTFMMWDYDPNQAGVSSQGLLAGRVYQSNADGSGFTALASGTTVSISLTDNPQYVTTTSDSCGTYSLFDPQRGGGTRSVTAVNNTTGQQIVATANEVNGIQPDDLLFSVTAGLESQYRNIGRLNFTFNPLTPPPPPPQINIGIYTIDGSGNRQAVSGIIQSGTPLTITFSSTLAVTGATINGASFSSVVADTPPANPIKSLIYSKLLDSYTAGSPGVYTITATAANPLNPSNSVTVSRSFLVVAAGGGNNYATANTPPAVVGAVPSPNSQGVPTSIFPVITFSEPVTNISGHVTLAGSPGGDSPSLLLIGVRADGSVANPIVASDAVTSLTIQPLTGLEFGETYTLTLTSGIVNVGKDQNGNSIPQLPLPAYTLQFSTFGPQQLGTTTSQYPVITRPVVIGQRAYTGELINSVITGLGIFNIKDPSNPIDLGAPASFVGRGTDAAGLTQFPATGGPLVAISAGTAQDVAIPGNVWLYDVSGPAQSPPTLPVRLGAVSVSSSATQAGIAIRLAIKNNYLYASTLYQGLQVIDVQQAISEYRQTSASDFAQAVSTEGQGFATDTIINAIQLPIASGGTATMFDLKADDFATSNSGNSANTQTLLVATGQLPFVMADPTLSGSSAVLYPSVSHNALSQTPLQLLSSDASTAYQFVLGRAVALGTIPVTNSSGATSNQHIAVLVGSGRVGPVASVNAAPLVPALMVVDLSQAYMFGQPFIPKPIGFLQLPVTPTDAVLNGNMALVATGTNVLAISLANPSQPLSAGQISGTFGNWLGLSTDGFLIGTSNSSGTSLKTAAFDAVIATQCPALPAVLVSGTLQNPIYQTVQPVTCTIRLVPSSTPASSSNFFLKQINQALVTSANNVPLGGGVGSVQLPAGLNISGNAATAESTAINTQTNQPIKTLVQTVNVIACQALNIGTVFANGDDVTAGLVIVNVKKPSVAFSATVQGASCPNVNYNWDFGDGSTSTDAAPTHSYPSKVKAYIVALTVNCVNCSTYTAQSTSFVVHIRETEFEVLYRAFLPPEVTPVPVPGFGSCVYQTGPDTHLVPTSTGGAVVLPVDHTRLLFVAGDNRGFTSDLNATTRTGTIATVDTEARDSSGGLEDGSYKFLSATSINIAEDALYSGHLPASIANLVKIVPPDQSTPVNNCSGVVGIAFSTGAENNVQVTRLGKHTIQAHLTGEARDALFPPLFTADIEWDWELTIDNDNAQATMYTLVGKQKAFPAHELYINGHYIYQYDPSRFGSTTILPSAGVYQDPTQPPIPPVVVPNFTSGLLQLVDPLINEPTMGPIGPAPIPIDPEFQ